MQGLEVVDDRLHHLEVGRRIDDDHALLAGLLETIGDLLGVQRLRLGGATATFRQQIWTSSFAMVRDHPLLGIGLDYLGYSRIANALGYGISAVFAIRANLDYYKKMLLNDNGWW